MMQQVNIHGPDEVRVDEVALPEPGPRDILVRVSACGICGSDLGYVKLGGLAGPTGEPMPLGHELSGIIESVGSEVADLSPGLRVVVNPIGANNNIGNGGAEGAFAPFLLVRNAADGGCVYPVPDDMPGDVAALAEPLSVGMQAVLRAGAKEGDKVVVFGAGPIGLAAIASLRWLGVEDVVAVDFSNKRLEIAQQLGAKACLDPGSDDVWQRIYELHGTASVMGMPAAGSDVYVEASGASVVIDQVIAQAKTEASLSIVALHRAPIPVSFLLVMLKSLKIVGSMAYPEDWSDTIKMLGEVDLTPMITHRFPLTRFDEALAVAKDPAAGAKVMIVNDPT